jgi:hypothetical protein
MLSDKIRESVKSLFFKNFLIVITEPFKDTGLITALTREPSLSLMSTIGDDSSICLPTCETILSIPV